MEDVYDNTKTTKLRPINMVHYAVSITLVLEIPPVPIRTFEIHLLSHQQLKNSVPKKLLCR